MSSYFIFAQEDCGATQLYGVACETPTAQYIVCTNMYKPIAEWLVKTLGTARYPE